jgi:hypothetical protein
LAVRVTHPWIPKDRGLSEYMNGDFSMSVYPSTVNLSHPPYMIAGGWDALPAHGNAAFAMGLWRSVHLTTLNMVTLTDLYVRTEPIQPDGSAQLDIGGALRMRAKKLFRVSALSSELWLLVEELGVDEVEDAESSVNSEAVL